MVQSLNIKVDLAIDTTAFTKLTDYGQIMIGDRGFEFYHTGDPCKLVQVPWEEVDYVLASVMFRGKWIPRCVIQTKKSGAYTFASKEPKRVLQAIREYIDPDHIIQSLNFFDVIKRGILLIGKEKK